MTASPGTKTNVWERRAVASAQAGLHAVRFNEMFWSVEITSEADHVKYASRYKKRGIQAIRGRGAEGIM